MLRTTLLACLLVGCLDPEPDISAIESAAIGERCPTHICGVNSDDEIDGGFFYDLNVDGDPNRDGWYVTGAMKGLGLYRLRVSSGRISATRYAGSGLSSLGGDDLEGLRIRLRRDGTSGPEYRTMKIEAVSRITDFWAKPALGSTPVIETYRFHLSTDTGYGALMCQHGEVLMDTTSPYTKMPEHHALVFEGDRIDIDNLTMSGSSSKWFTIGCAKSVIAKVHLLGHTQVANRVAGFVNTIPERQTLLKMLTADYCGTGRSFTVRGQPVYWTDDDGTIAPPSGAAKVLEARWTPDGASCLNTPRVAAHPTPQSELEFPFLESQIAWQCDRPPPCPPIDVVHHLNSWNPTPFTN